MRKSSVVRRVGKKVRTAGCVACAVCLLFLVVNAQDQAQIEFFEQVASLIRDNRLAEAEKDLSAVLRRSPEQPVALNFMGTIRAKQSRFLEAETLFNRALRNDKSFTAPRMNLVYLYLLKHTPDKAIVQLREVLTIEPDNAEAVERLPELLLSQGRIDECITFIEKRKAAGPIPASQLVLLGDAYLEKKSLQQAEDNYLLALEGRLDNAGALFGLAQISRLKGETKEAAIYLNRVATLISDSNSPELLYKFSMEAMRIGLFDQAKSALERSLAIKPNEPNYMLALGIAWLRKGDLFEAEKVFRRLIQIQPNNAEAQLHLGYVLLNQKKYDEARVWLEKSVRPGAAIPEVYYYLGLVEQEQNNDAQAIVLFEKAVRQLPSYAHARIALGASYMKVKNYLRAREELETAVKLDPEEPTGHYNLALLYARIKEPAKAQEEMKIIDRLKSKGASSGGVVVRPPGSSPN